MTNLDTGTYGAKVQSWKRANPRDLLKRLMDENGSANKADLLKLFRDEVKAEEDHLDSVIEYWFANNYYSLTERPAIDAPAARAQRQAKVAEIKEKVQTRVREQAQMMLLDMIMPNGKALRDCTGKDCAKAGGWLSKIATKVKPNQLVGKALSETDVRKLYGR